jgi:predicted transposase YbfD/YdcC
LVKPREKRDCRSPKSPEDLGMIGSSFSPGCSSLPKKTTQAIIDSNNDHIITVKKNQLSLYKLLEEKSDYSQAIDKDIQEEKIFYLSSLKMTAQEFGIKIREHWKIENQLQKV